MQFFFYSNFLKQLPLADENWRCNTWPMADIKGHELEKNRMHKQFIEKPTQRIS